MQLHECRCVELAHLVNELHELGRCFGSDVIAGALADLLQQAGQIDFIYALSAEQVPLFADNPNFTIQSVPTGRWVGLVMNTQLEPFNDPRVRKAIRMSADREVLDG